MLILMTCLFLAPASTLVVINLNSTSATPLAAYVPISLNTCGVEKIRDFLPISRYISQTIQNVAIVTMAGNIGNRTQAIEWHQF